MIRFFIDWYFNYCKCHHHRRIMVVSLSQMGIVGEVDVCPKKNEGNVIKRITRKKTNASF